MGERFKPLMNGALETRRVGDCSASELLEVVGARLEAVGEEFALRVVGADGESSIEPVVRASSGEAAVAWATARYPAASSVEVVE